MSSQRYLTASMRAILVDWLVEVQENFELNHETLYLAVKLVDMYVSRVCTRKESLQLVGAVALFIASKFDVSRRRIISLKKKWETNAYLIPHPTNILQNLPKFYKNKSCQIVDPNLPFDALQNNGNINYIIEINFG